jgi:hypothetical protein
MKRFLWILIAPFLLTSCFEVIEELTYHEDGSGHFVFTVNMSQSSDRLATIMTLDSMGGLNVPTKSKIENKVNTGAQLLKTVPGVSNVMSTKNYKDFIFTIELDFKSLDDLNTAARILHENMSPFGEAYRQVYAYHEGKLTRVPDAHTTRFLSYINGRNSSLLKDANYTLIMRFDQTVKSADAHARISKSKKAVMYKYNLKNIAEHRDEMNCSIIVSQ